LQLRRATRFLRLPTQTEWELPLQRTVRTPPFFFLSAWFGGFLMLLASVACVSHSALAAGEGPFHEFAGSWSGSGTVRPSNGTAERIRCNANYRQRGSSQHEIDLQLRCASDSYNFDLIGQFSADEDNHVSGRWTERTRGIGGTAVGYASGDRLQIHVESSGFAADLVMQTRNRRQSVTIDSQGGGQIIKASITLSR
jgi:hypothetical protein